MKTITITADDRVGLLADISYVLGKAKINIESVGVDVLAGKAVITLIIKDFAKAKSALLNSGFTPEEENSVVVKLTDQPGELSKITSMLAAEKISIQRMHIISRDGSNTILSFRVDNPKRASKILDQYLLNKDLKD
ncbi:MAG: ACT domain-containing protein [Candidatus Micrarchaeota archaeon]